MENFDEILAGAKQGSELFKMAERYIFWDVRELKQHLTQKKGKEWMEANWAQFNKYRNKIKAKPPVHLRQDVKDFKVEQAVGDSRIERFDDMERTTEILGAKIKKNMEDLKKLMKQTEKTTVGVEEVKNKFQGVSDYINLTGKRLAGLKEQHDKRLEQIELKLISLEEQVEQEKEEKKKLQEKLDALMGNKENVSPKKPLPRV